MKIFELEEKLDQYFDVKFALTANRMVTVPKPENHTLSLYPYMILIEPLGNRLIQAEK
jgi:hypothetical protein